MPDEKLNDINEVQDVDALRSKRLHPLVPDSELCWCGSESMHPRGPTCHAPVPSGPVDHHRTLLRIEALLRQLLEAVTPRNDPAAPRAPMPLQPGDRASYNGRRGVLRSIGVAGTGILYDDGRYALLTNAMAAKLVRE